MSAQNKGTPYTLLRSYLMNNHTMSVKEAAKLIEAAPSTVRLWGKEGLNEFPKLHVISPRKAFFIKEEVEEWARNKLILPN